MSENKVKIKAKEKEESIRGAVGGQAVIEGVMMKSKDNIAIAVRRRKGEIVKKIKPFKSIRDKYKILNIPIIRGFVNFIEMMKMAMSTLNDSAEMLGLDDDDEEENIENAAEIAVKPEKEVKAKSESKSMIAAASIIGTVLGLALSFGLFFFLPTFIGSQITGLTNFEKGGWFISMTEGIVRLAIFILYILLVTLIPDIKRTFQYHGAEHMAVFCYEAKRELTVENVREYSRFHPRCGTSFMIVMMLIGIIISMFIPDFTGENFNFSNNVAFWLRLAVKLSVFPFIIGIGYEFIKYAGKHDSAFVRIASAPGKWTQLLTTKKPDDKQIEVAVVSLRTALKIDKTEETEPDNKINAG
ncbi:MAG: DUF1385 domain-containing protein [Oscillospiraceae bacterium]|nr:DUF1385 domain-containing protein [Oscillospiraceae bacterium]